MDGYKVAWAISGKDDVDWFEILEKHGTSRRLSGNVKTYFDFLVELTF